MDYYSFTDHKGWKAELNHRCAQCRLLNRARGHVPPLLQMAGHGGTMSRRTANKKLTKLCWPSRKRSTKRLIILLEQKKCGGTRPKKPPHFRSGPVPPAFKLVPAPLGVPSKFLDGPNLRLVVHVLQTIYDLCTTTLWLGTNRNQCVTCVWNSIKSWRGFYTYGYWKLTPAKIRPCWWLIRESTKGRYCWQIMKHGNRTYSSAISNDG